jgi:hypothetical protein
MQRKANNWKCMLESSRAMKNVLFSILVFASSVTACRLWGVVAQQGHVLSGNDSGNYALISEELRTYYLQGSAQPQGWALGFYRNDKLVENQTLFRSQVSTNLDSIRYYNAVGQMLAPSENARIALGHVRTASSGAIVIPDPHPFLFVRDSICYCLVHNGTLSKEILVDLLTESGKDSVWLKNNPPHTYGNGDWRSDGFQSIVDSELLLLWLMKNIEKSGDILTGLAIAATRLATSVPGADQKNFILSDGKRLYISGGNGSLFYRWGAAQVTYEGKTYSVNHQAVMTEPPTSGLAANLGWTSIQDHQLAVLSPDTAVFYSLETLRALAQTSALRSSDNGEYDKGANGPKDGIHGNHHIGFVATGAQYASLSIYSLSGKRIHLSVLPVLPNQRISLMRPDGGCIGASVKGMAMYVLTVGNKSQSGIVPMPHGGQFGLKVEGN